MRQKKRCLSFTGAMLLGISALAQTPIPDAQIEANVLKALAGAPQLANENITSNTVYGVVTLIGTVKDEPTRVMAENLAARASGVKKVVDELGIGQSAAGGSNRDALGDATNPMLQSDGTMAPAPAGQPLHAPDPEVYAAQQAQQGALEGAQQAGNQQAGNQQAGDYHAAPLSRRPPYNDQQAPPQGGQDRSENVGPPFQPGSRPLDGPRRQGPSQPPPFGAQEAGTPVVVQPGALLRVRINEGLDSKHTQPGTLFDAVVLNDVVADGAVAIPRGASMQGKVVEAKSGGAIKGHGRLSLQLTTVTLGGRVFPIVSDVWDQESSGKGEQTFGSALGLGAAGALIGAIAGGGGGAVIGAVAGSAAGVGTSAASGGRQVIIPSEAILTFHMAQPAPLTTISQAEMDRLSDGVPVGSQQRPQMVRRRYPQPYYGPPGYYPPPPPPPAYPQPY